MRVRSSGSLMSTRPGRGVVTSARRDEGCDRRPLAAEARRQRARGLARGEVTDLHAVDGAVGVGFHDARVVEADANGPVYRVQVGDLPTREAARALAARLSGEGSGERRGGEGGRSRWAPEH